MLTRVLLAVVLATVIPALTPWETASSSAARRGIWVAVRGPRDWAPDPGYSLEIGDATYRIERGSGGGVVSVDRSAPTIVRLRRLRDCQPVVRFIARPGGRYVIRITEDDTPHVEDWSSLGLDAGPALTAGPRSCDPLPDTSTSEPRRGPADLGFIVIVVGAVTMLLMYRGHPRTRRPG